MLFLIFSCVLFVSAAISGIKLRKGEAPYSKAFLSIHKLSSMAGILLLAIYFNNILELSFSEISVEMIFVFALVALLITSIFSGGLLSHKDEKNKSLENTHRISSFLSFLLLIVIAIII